MIPEGILALFAAMLYSLRLGDSGSFLKPLSREQEQHYLSLAAAGDLEARNVLIERNMRLVAHIMKKYYAQSADQEDLISIGTIGLIKGISTFDPSKGARLATYAARCIENAILTQRKNTARGLPQAVLFHVMRSQRTVTRYWPPTVQVNKLSA